MRVRKALHALGFRYRLHDCKLPGNPDIVLPKYRAVIFVHGCFWHGHHCHLFKIPKTRTEFWMTKIDGNVQRDVIARKQLLDTNWRVAIVWGCALQGRKKYQVDALISELGMWLISGQSNTLELNPNYPLGDSSPTPPPTPPLKGVEYGF